MKTESILVIKLGALGDFVQALGPCAAIRAHHRTARIVLLTTAPLVALAEQAPYFDDIWVDDRPHPAQVHRWLSLRRRLRSRSFARVYDLQTNGRSSAYFRLFWPGPRPEWSGIARGASHPDVNPRRNALHTLDRQAEQLRLAGIDIVPPPDLSWVRGDIGGLGIAARFVLLVPGGSAHRPGKRWPAASYVALAQTLTARDLQPVLIGTAAEADVLEEIRRRCPAAVSLAGRTSLAELVVLARHAVAAVGNDTGPMHLAAAAGCPSMVLFSRESDPAQCAPRGPAVRILRREALTELRVEEVVEAFDSVLAPAGGA